MTRKLALSLLLLLPFPMITLTSVAQAAQDGRVQTDSAKILQTANPAAPVLGTLARGQVIRISDQAVSGYYKTLVPGKRQVGFIRASDVAPLPRKEAARRPKALERAKSYALVFGDFHYVQSIDPNSSGILAPMYGGEFGFRPDPEFALFGMVALHSFSRSDATAYGAKGTILAVGFEKVITDQPTLSFSFAIAAGVSMGTKITANTAAGVSTSAAQTLPTGLLKLRARTYLGQNFALLFELGYRYLQKHDVPLNAATSVDTNLSGPLAGLGLQLEF